MTIFTPFLIAALISVIVVVALRYLRKTNNTADLDTAPIEGLVMIVGVVCLIVWIVQIITSSGI